MADCPVCGTEVEVATTPEGTSHYLPGVGSEEGRRYHAALCEILRMRCQHPEAEDEDEDAIFAAQFHEAARIAEAALGGNTNERENPMPDDKGAVAVEPCGCMTAITCEPERLSDSLGESFLGVVRRGGTVARVDIHEAKLDPNFLPAVCPHDPPGWRHGMSRRPAQ